MDIDVIYLHSIKVSGGDFQIKPKGTDASPQGVSSTLSRIEHRTKRGGSVTITGLTDADLELLMRMIGEYLHLRSLSGSPDAN